MNTITHTDRVTVIGGFSMTLPSLFGIVGAAIGIVAAGLWYYASRIRWTTARELKMLPGDNGPHGEFFGKTYFMPGGLEAYQNDIGKWNSRAALATALSMTCWALQTIADVLSCAPSH
jgi:hypothetical protein